MACIEGETEWQKITTAWDKPEVKALLSAPMPFVLPTSGPLHQLLSVTRQLLRQLYPSMPAIKLPAVRSVNTTPRQAAILSEAVEAQAVGPLLHMAGWLQQHPNMDLKGSVRVGTVTSDWVLLITAIYWFLVYMEQKDELAFRSTWEQLLLATGKQAVSVGAASKSAHCQMAP